jgi:3-phenylpropionate/cinnamic acid dioxygenase small subunit
MLSQSKPGARNRLQRGLSAAALAAAIAFTSTPIRAQNAEFGARLQALEDEAEIRYLLDHYMDLLGAADWDNYVLLFAEDGELQMDEGTRRGRQDIKERMSAATARMAGAATGQPRRQRADMLSNIRVRVDGNVATAQSRFTMLGESADGSFHVTGSGIYSDTWVRANGSWLIKSRKVDWDMLRGASPAD